MAKPVIMPRQGQSVESCIISAWFKQPGETVEAGEVLFSYETDKAAFEFEAESAGTLLKRFYEEGDEVPVLKTVALIGDPGESTEGYQEGAGVEAAVQASVPARPADQEPRNPEEEEVPLPIGHGARVPVSPRARKKAAELGIQAGLLSGSGPGGRITEQDVLRAAAVQPGATPLARAVAESTGKLMPVSGTGLGNRVTAADLDQPVSTGGFEVRKISNMRKIIASRMLDSLRNSAQLTHHTSADARKLLELRKKAKEASEKGLAVNITINDLVCWAVIRALKKHPMANCHFLGDTIRVFNKVNLGFAVDTERGLMVPALPDADDLDIRQLSGRLKSLADECKKGSIDPQLLSSEAASFSVSNLGAYGVELFTPVINLPQVAILGVNTIISRPADLGNGVFGFIPHIGLSLTYDHRALDGAPASAFLREIRNEIEQLSLEI